MDIVVWLRSLGLGKYEATFRENEIDETILPNLTGPQGVGVTALGHRRKLLDAIAALRADAGIAGRPFKTSGVDAFHFGAAATVSPGGRILITKAVLFSPGANGPATAFFTGGMLCRNAAIASASSLERKENA
jgi:SAM domain (Sterile alpha motif)